MATTEFTEDMVRNGDLDVNGDRSIEEIGAFPETAKRISSMTVLASARSRRSTKASP